MGKNQNDALITAKACYKATLKAYRDTGKVLCIADKAYVAMIANCNNASKAHEAAIYALEAAKAAAKK